MTMCLLLSDSVLTSGGDISRNNLHVFCWAYDHGFTHTHIQLCTHEMTECCEWRIFLCKTSSFVCSFLVCLPIHSSQTVPVLVILLNYSSLCPQKSQCCLYFYFMNSVTTPIYCRNSSLLILLIPEVRPGRQQAPGVMVSHLRLLKSLPLIQSTNEYALKWLDYRSCRK